MQPVEVHSEMHTIRCFHVRPESGRRDRAASLGGFV